MTAGAALRAAFVATYRNSPRLVALNAMLVGIAVGLAVATAFAWPVAVLGLALGPFAAAVAHCAVVLRRTDDLRFADFGEGLRLHWRRGLVLGAATAAVFGFGALAVHFYASHGTWPLAAIVAYVLAGAAVFELALWPLAVAEPERPLPDTLRAAAVALLVRPRATAAFAAAILLVNVLGVAAAFVPLLTLTVAYSLVAAAYFVVPPDPSQEA
jgi:hypothetical protein